MQMTGGRLVPTPGIEQMPGANYMTGIPSTSSFHSILFVSFNTHFRISFQIYALDLLCLRATASVYTSGTSAANMYSCIACVHF